MGFSQNLALEPLNNCQYRRLKVYYNGITLYYFKTLTRGAKEVTFFFIRKKLDFSEFFENKRLKHMFQVILSPETGFNQLI